MLSDRKLEKKKQSILNAALERPENEELATKYKKLKLAFRFIGSAPHNKMNDDKLLYLKKRIHSIELAILIERQLAAAGNAKVIHDADASDLAATLRTLRK